MSMSKLFSPKARPFETGAVSIEDPEPWTIALRLLKTQGF